MLGLGGDKLRASFSSTGRRRSSFCVCFGDTPGGAQGLTLALCSGVTLGGNGSGWGAYIRYWASNPRRRTQSKRSTRCAISPFKGSSTAAKTEHPHWSSALFPIVKNRSGLGEGRRGAGAQPRHSCSLWNLKRKAVPKWSPRLALVAASYSPLAESGTGILEPPTLEPRWNTDGPGVCFRVRRSWVLLVLPRLLVPTFCRVSPGPATSLLPSPTPEQTSSGPLGGAALGPPLALRPCPEPPSIGPPRLGPRLSPVPISVSSCTPCAPFDLPQFRDLAPHFRFLISISPEPCLLSPSSRAPPLRSLLSPYP